MSHAVSRSPGLWLAALGVTLTVWLCPAPVLASMGDVFGLSARSQAMVNAAVASTDDWENAYLNPSALALMSPGVKVGFGYTFVFSGLKAGGEDQGLVGNDGITAGVAGIIPLAGVMENRLAAAFTLFLPRKDIMWLHLHMKDSIHFPRYENRMQRLVVRPALAARLYESLSLGVAINYYIELTGGLETRSDATRSLDSRSNLELFHRFSADFSLSGEPLEGLRLALVYRMEHRTPTHFLTQNRIGDIMLDLDITGTCLYEPHTLTAGASYRFDRIGLLLELDASWRMWHFYPSPFTILDASVPSGTPQNKTFDPVAVDVGANDTVSLGLAAEQTFTVAARWTVSLRGGLGYESKALPYQDGETNLMDSHVVKAGLGFGFGYTREDGSPFVSVDLGAQFHILPWQTYTKKDELMVDADLVESGLQCENPGYPKVSGGGFVAATGLTVRIEL